MMMHITLEREIYLEDATLGFMQWGSYLTAYTRERAYPATVEPGTYQIKMCYPDVNREMPAIMADEPYIIGWEPDADLRVGTYQQGNDVVNTRSKFAEMLPELEQAIKAGDCTITIEGR